MSISSCITNKIFITDIKLLLNILQLEKLSSNNENNKIDLFNRKEELTKKINKEIEEISEKNNMNNINPYISTIDNTLYDKEKKDFLDIIENLKKENQIIKEDNMKYSKLNENLTFKLNKITLKQELSSKLEAKKKKKKLGCIMKRRWKDNKGNMRKKLKKCKII